MSPERVSDPTAGVEPRVVLSVEQALALPYATLRFVQLGWRVIRVEPTPVPERKSKGDPNRFIGRPVAGEDRHSYFVGPNVGKQAIALNLKHAEGRELLWRLVRELPVDVFCTNTLPSHHAGLGIDDASLRRQREDLIWCGISALGGRYPKTPGYDPALQALSGYMDLTGESDGPPLQCGPPVIDLKAGDELFAQVLLALLRRQATGEGARIDISMARLAASWLQTFLPMLDMGSPPEELRRHGNEHRQFIPVNAYPSSDGFIYVAIGSDAQWERLVGHRIFAPLDQERYHTNEGRREHRRELHSSLAAICSRHTRAELGAVFAELAVPHAPISAIEEVAGLDWLAPLLLRTRTPAGGEVRLPPAPLDNAYLEGRGGELPFAPAYGEHTDSVLGELGLDQGRLDELRERGTIA